MYMHPFINAVKDINDIDQMTAAVKAHILSLPISVYAKLVEFKAISRITKLKLQRKSSHWTARWENCGTRWDFLFNQYSYRIIDDKESIIISTDSEESMI